MSRMSEVHQDLVSIHQILLGHRKVAQKLWDKTHVNSTNKMWLGGKIVCIDDLLLEIEAAGVNWPDNVVDIGSVS